MFSFLKRKAVPPRPAKQVPPCPSSHSSRDDGFDGAGFVFGLTTGVPISPARGISVESVVGASIHNSDEAAASSHHHDTASHGVAGFDSSSASSGGSDFSTGGGSSYDSGSSSSFDSSSSSGSSDSGSW